MGGGVDLYTESTYTQVNMVAGKVHIMEFQPSNLHIPLACSLILWKHNDDVKKALKGMSVSLQWVWRN